MFVATNFSPNFMIQGGGKFQRLPNSSMLQIIENCISYIGVARLFQTLPRAMDEVEVSFCCYDSSTPIGKDIAATAAQKVFSIQLY
jgi:hypothetical protein